MAVKCDDKRNLFLYDFAGGTIRTIDSTGVLNATNFAVGWRMYNENGSAFDLSGNLIVTNFFGNTLIDVTPSGLISVFANGFNTPRSVVVDCTGRAFVANLDGIVSMLLPQDSIASSYIKTSPNISTLYGIDLDSVGVLYVVDSNTTGGSLWKILPPFGMVLFFSLLFHFNRIILFFLRHGYWQTNNGCGMPRICRRNDNKDVNKECNQHNNDNNKHFNCFDYNKNGNAGATANS